VAADPSAPEPAPAQLDLIRAAVGTALDVFLARQRAILAAAGDELLPCLDAMSGLLAGGKRLRPAFCYWGWRAAGGQDCAEIFAAAAALELLQASALVHDDVMDASETRRGQPAVHRRFAQWHAATGLSGSADQFGASAAILIGDLLLAWTSELYLSSGFPPHVLHHGMPVLALMQTELAAGQYLDLVGQVSRDTSVPEALRVISYKTTKYTTERPLQLGAALAAGGGGAAAADTIAGAFSRYGRPLGIAFQLRDDVLGVFGDPARTGKPVGGDISEGKRTVLIALARERASARQAADLDRHLGYRGLTQAAVTEVQSVLADTGALAECEAMIAACVKEAVSALDGAPITEEARSALTDLAVLVSNRDE